MKTLEKGCIDSAIVAVNQIKNYVIGIYKSKYMADHEYALIIEDNGDTIDTVEFTTLGAINTFQGVPKSQGHVKMFQGMYMSGMLNDPFKFNEFMNEFKKEIES